MINDCLTWVTMTWRIRHYNLFAWDLISCWIYRVCVIFFSCHLCEYRIWLEWTVLLSYSNSQTSLPHVFYSYEVLAFSHFTVFTIVSKFCRSLKKRKFLFHPKTLLYLPLSCKTCCQRWLIRMPIKGHFSDNHFLFLIAWSVSSMVADDLISVGLVLNKMHLGSNFLLRYRHWTLRCLHIVIKLFKITKILPFMVTCKSSTRPASLEILLRSGLSLKISLVTFKGWVFSLDVLLSPTINVSSPAWCFALSWRLCVKVKLVLPVFHN
jgi:hypothetical protein